MTENFFDSVRSKCAGSVPELLRALSTVRDRVAGLADWRPSDWHLSDLRVSGAQAGQKAAEVRARAIGLGSSAKDWIEARDTPSRRTGALSIAAAVAIGGLVGGAVNAVETDLELERQSVVTELAAVQGGEGGGDPDPDAAEPVPAAEPAPDPAPEPAAEPQGPVPPVDDMAVTSPFGYRNNPMAPGALEFHTGTDFGAGTGTPVKAMLGGTVTEAGWHTTGGGGLRVVVDHGDGLQTTYNHLNSIDVSVGQAVDAGVVVGGIGSTGNSTGPHLHFEVLRHGNYEDPMGWL
ncbi:MULTISPECIES: M23 family metallopeptidase [unclassified Arthrobacter]|uniref:M23 family metallopeptidase n=1 Tax=unclassified Arthrobacter TaxID=235627 RepID=UPI001E5889F0|nr:MULTISPECIES: M23 family metallopeptidase [unclassified Arthrobacter]MCC9144635.1 M23 family metallopeptidase [Arthrobacter sp. zg-Y919]MDK1275861.1 M23 family metallopeptidase [Arthrobacter sp. zg.Y919]WIB02779.1 M23 family metallopeptidase [Arthrobacter sp. zg-Y919]